MTNGNGKTREDLPALPERKERKELLVSSRGYLIPNSLDTQWQMANIFASSGLAPKGMEKVATLFTAIQLGAEVGLAPMQAIQNIAVVNGRPTLWGDAQLALVRTHPDFDFIKERVEGSGPNMTATCEVKRKSDVMSVVQTFSVEDAKRANLWGKQGPWSQYPKRMLQMRARGFALRDAFTDVLKGLSMSREEALDLVQTEDGSYAAPEAQEVNAAIKKVKKDKKAEPTKAKDLDKNAWVCPNCEQTNAGYATACGRCGMNPETGEIEDEDAADPWERSKWINLRKPGFAKYVADNATTLGLQTEELIAEVRNKFYGFYPDAEFPVEEKVEKDPEPQGADPGPEDPFTDKQAQGLFDEEPKKRACPDRNGDLIFEDYCNEDCPHREGCPAWD